jgi:hypothetical protein
MDRRGGVRDPQDAGAGFDETKPIFRPAGRIFRQMQLDARRKRTVSAFLAKRSQFLATVGGVILPKRTQFRILGAAVRFAETGVSALWRNEANPNSRLGDSH